MDHELLTVATLLISFRGLSPASQLGMSVPNNASKYDTYTSLK